MLRAFYREYFQYLPEGYDDVYILHSNSGEAYCFLAYLAKAIMKRNNAQNPLFVATKPYHEDIINLFFPKARQVYYDMYLKEPRLKLIGDSIEFNGHHFYQLFSDRHFVSVNSNLGAIHYFNAMLKTLDLTMDDVSKPTPKIPTKTKKTVLSIAERINLDLDNFIIIAPEALTTNEMPTEFWNNLIKRLYQKGYDVFLNVVKPTKIEGKTTKLTLSELFALANLARGCVSLRSGISEFLIPSKTKNIVLCPRFHWSPCLKASQCIDAYSILKLPYVDKNKIFELNPEQYNNNSGLIDHILKIVNE